MRATRLELATSGMASLRSDHLSHTRKFNDEGRTMKDESAYSLHRSSFILHPYNSGAGGGSRTLRVEFLRLARLPVAPLLRARSGADGEIRTLINLRLGQVRIPDSATSAIDLVESERLELPAFRFGNGCSCSN